MPVLPDNFCFMYFKPMLNPHRFRNILFSPFLVRLILSSLLNASTSVTSKTSCLKVCFVDSTFFWSLDVKLKQEFMVACLSRINF